MPQSLIIRWIAATAAVLVAAVAVVLAPLAARGQQVSACRLLEQELATYGNTARGGPEVAQLNQAIAQQQGALTTTESHAHRIGCYKRGFLFFQPSRPPECPRLVATVEKMKRNLAELTARRDRLAGPSQQNDPGRQRILRLLAENNCGPQYSRFATTRRPRGLLDRLFEEDSGPQDDWRGGIYGERMLGDVPTYRTLCVRKCDGYYFPISFATLPEHFEQDAQQCRSQCPSAVVELYVYQNPGGSVENMVSLSGQPYASIPTAFQYRKEYVEGCSCNPYTLALEKAEKMAAKSDGTVEVPDIVPQDESGAPVPAPGPGDEATAPSPAPSASTEPPNDAAGVNIYRGGENQPRYLDPYPSPGPTDRSNRPSIFTLPPPEASAPPPATPSEEVRGGRFKDPSEVR